MERVILLDVLCFVCNFTRYFGIGLATYNFLIGDTGRREFSGDVSAEEKKW